MPTNNRNQPRLAIVSPCYHEEQALPLTIQALEKLLLEWVQKGLIAENSFLFLVDDGSKDKTWSIIEQAHARNPSLFKGLKLAQNVGHQKALFAGLCTVRDICDCVVSIDADLQDDITTIEKMLAEFRAGRDLVFGVRQSRATDTFFKKWSAQLFYKLMSLLGARVIYNHADFRLMSKKILGFFCEFGEQNLFLRGLSLLTTKNYSLVYYDRHERVAGESKYPLRKMLSFAWEGITSFSTKPLHFIAVLGLAVSLLSLAMGAYSLYRYVRGETIPGWTSVFISIYFLGGVQLLSLGVIGQYVGKLYVESKRRPHYFEDQKLS